MTKGQLYREQAVVLRTIKLGEADRIVSLMTEGRGKVRAVAKGVRKTTSRFGARLEPLRHVSLQLYEGRELDTVTQAESIEHFRPVRDDLDRLTRALALAEAVDQVAQEREVNPRLYQMLLGGLRTLAAHPAPAIVGAFFWKLLAAQGFEPMLDGCVRCGTGEGLVALDLEDGGLLCQPCRQHGMSGIAVTAGAVAMMRSTLGGDLVAVLHQPVSPAVHEVEHLATRALEHHVERRIRSVRMLGSR